MAKIQGITDRLLRVINQNDQAPALEKIDREEFIIDFQKRDILISESDQLISAIRKEANDENMKLRVIKNRIKSECWDAMEVIGKSVKSFKPDIMLGKKIDVTNYPLRKRDPALLEKIEKIKRLRNTEVQIKNLCEKSEDSEKLHDVETEVILDVEPCSISSELTVLLYSPFELISNERRRVQAYILLECIQDIKSKFNIKFQELSLAKSDEISKIEDKIERIKNILSLIGIHEEIFQPELDSDEVPESVINIHDSEIKFEKVLSAEEKKREGLRRKGEEELHRQQAEDNARERALMSMMGGTLEDK